jgi:hypothetical protein
MNCSQYIGDSEEALFGNFIRAFKQFPKYKYKVKQIAGDLYYEEMSTEETIEKMFLRPESPDKILRNQKEIDMYIRDNLNTKLPLDGPLLRIYY